MKLSVVIPCLNGAATIGAQLEALAKQDWEQPWEIVLADNGSTDETLSIVARYRDRLPNLRVVDASARGGQPYALNIGAFSAAGDTVAFCDADDEVAPGWVSAMGQALSNYDFVACRYDIQKLNATWLQKAFQNPQQDGLQKIDYPPYLQHAGGGSLGIKRSLLLDFGGFDESLPYLHDTDLCFRLQLAGVKLHFVPGAVLHLRYRANLSGVYRQACAWGEYSVLLCKRYQQSTGMKMEHAWVRYLKRWKALFWRLPQIRSREGRAAWIRTLGWQIGRLQGSLKHKIAPV